MGVVGFDGSLLLQEHKAQQKSNTEIFLIAGVLCTLAGSASLFARANYGCLCDLKLQQHKMIKA